MSLANLIRKRGIANPLFLSSTNSLGYVTKAIAHVDTARVNIQNIADEQEREDLEDACPPRANMWFEWAYSSRIGCLVDLRSRTQTGNPDLGTVVHSFKVA